MSVLKHRITAVLAGSALVVGIGATGAVAGSLITSRQIENGTIRSVDVKDESLRLADLRPSALERLSGSGGTDGVDGINGTNGVDGTNGTNGVDGIDGADGATGPQGAAGLADVRADEPYVHTIEANSVGVAWTACPEGKAALGGGFRLNGFAAEAFQGGGSAVDVTAIASEPVGVLNGEVVNTYQNEAFPQDDTGSFLPNAWAVTVQNDSDQPQDVRVAVVCAAVAD